MRDVERKRRRRHHQRKVRRNARSAATRPSSAIRDGAEHERPEARVVDPDDPGLGRRRVVEIVHALRRVGAGPVRRRGQVAERDDVAGRHEISARSRERAALADHVGAWFPGRRPCRRRGFRRSSARSRRRRARGSRRRCRCRPPARTRSCWKKKYVHTVVFEMTPCRRRVGDREEHAIVGERRVEVVDRRRSSGTRAGHSGRAARPVGLPLRTLSKNVSIGRVEDPVGNARGLQERPNAAVDAHQELGRPGGARGVGRKRIRVGEGCAPEVDADRLRSGGSFGGGSAEARGRRGRARRFRAPAEVLAASPQARTWRVPAPGPVRPAPAMTSATDRRKGSVSSARIPGAATNRASARTRRRLRSAGRSVVEDICAPVYGMGDDALLRRLTID